VELERSSLPRRLLKTGLAYGLSWTGISKLVQIRERAANKSLVVCYHRTVQNLAANTNDILPSMLISREMLERQLDWIGRSYSFVSLDDLGLWLEGKKKFSHPIAAVTFDDGYRDVYYNAFPLLKRKGIPAAVFVVTDLVGKPDLLVHDKLFLLLSRAFSPQDSGLGKLMRFLRTLAIDLSEKKILRNGRWSRSRAASSLLMVLSRREIDRVIHALEADTQIEESALNINRCLSWEMILEMHRAGVTIGSHSHSHAVMINEKSDKMMQEANSSRETLQRKLRTKIQHFAYPDGQFNDAAIRAVAASGYRFAYTTCGHQHAVYPTLTIPRMILWENSSLDASGRFSPAILNCQIRGIFDVLKPCRRLHLLPEASDFTARPEPLKETRSQGAHL
jgi:peptidoglycan/xylan/chitin deacetylase (PgdA/CDA1 family)